MKKLSEYQDEEALDVLADILEPAIDIFSDKQVVEEMSSGGNKIKMTVLILKQHKNAVVQILARLNNTTVEDFHFNITTLPAMVLEIINDKELWDFFQLQAQKDGENTSGLALVTTEDHEK